MSATEQGIHQRRLNLELSHRTVLITTDSVRANKGWDTDTVLAKVDCGEIRWVWNVAIGREIEELRFWAKEFIAPEFVTGLSPAQVVAEIVGQQRGSWRGTEVAQLLLVSRPTVMRLVKSGELRGEVINGVIQVYRDALSLFLLHRLRNAPSGAATALRGAVSAQTNGGNKS